MTDTLLADLRTKRLIKLVVEAANGRRAHGDSDVTLVKAMDAVLLRSTPEVRIGHDGPEVGGKTYSTDFYFHGYQFRHAFMLPDPDEGGLPEGWEEMFPG